MPTPITTTESSKSALQQTQGNAMASRPNSTSLKARSSRLTAFVRGSSDAQAPYNGPAPRHAEQPQRSDTPPIPAPADVPIPSREEIAENARVPIPRVFRPQPLTKTSHNPSPPKHSRQPKVEQDMHGSPELGKPFDHEEEDEDLTRRQLFEGSQLGENFMKSGLTTPQNEPADLWLDTGREIGYWPQEEHHERRQPESFKRHQNHKSRAPVFEWSDEGGMVVKYGRGRPDPADVRDGFQNGDVNESMPQRNGSQHRPASPAGNPRSIPIREVKIHRPRTSVRNIEAPKPRPKSPSPRKEHRNSWNNYKEGTRGTSMVIEIDDDETRMVREDAHETPRAKKVTAPPRAHMESNLAPAVDITRHIPTKKRTRPTPDYDDMALSAMAYSQLDQEPFDLDPAQAAMQNGHRGNADTLATRLEHLGRQSEREQRSFFSSLSMDDWEESGDWFVDRFSDIMNKLKEARRGKRRMIREFEDEAARHEEAVRLRSEAIDQKLIKMRQDGMRVVGERGS